MPMTAANVIKIKRIIRVAIAISNEGIAKFDIAVKETIITIAGETILA